MTVKRGARQVECAARAPAPDAMRQVMRGFHECFPLGLVSDVGIPNKVETFF